MESNSYKVLIVDDQQYDLQLMLNCLFEGGFLNTICCTNSKAAIQLTLEEHPDIIILDWDIPEISGVEVIRILKKKEASKNIPMIITTGEMVSSPDIKYALEAGASDYIKKPFDKVELVARMKSSINFSLLLKSIQQQNIILTKQYQKASYREERLKTIINAASEAVIFIKNDIITEVSNRFIDYTNYSYSELIGSSINSLTTPDEQILLTKLINSESIFTCLSIVTKDNRHLPCEVHMHPFRINGDNIKVLSFLHLDEKNVKYSCENVKICSTLKTENEKLKTENLSLKRKLELISLKQYHLNLISNKLLTQIKFLKESPHFSDNIHKTEICKIIQELSKMLNEKIWEELKLRISDVHSEYFSNLLNRYPSLTETDLRILAFIKLNLSTKEISDITCQETNTIKAARKRIRRKLGIHDSKISLISFLANF